MVTLTRCPYPHPSHLQDSDGLPRPEGVHPPVFPALRQSRVVSSTSEEEEALTEKFLKINCKYISDGKVRCHVVTPINEYGHLFKINHSAPSWPCDRQIFMNCCSQKDVLSAANNYSYIWPMEREKWFYWYQRIKLNIYIYQRKFCILGTNIC